MAPKTQWAAVAVLCAVFFFCGQTFLRNIGPQMDETQFIGSVFAPIDDTAAIHVGGARIPVMIDAYAGSLKALLYTPLLRARKANTYNLRMPVLAAGTPTLFLYFLFFLMAMGRAAAVAGTAILALDPLFAITSTLDSCPGRDLQAGGFEILSMSRNGEQSRGQQNWHVRRHCAPSAGRLSPGNCRLRVLGRFCYAR
jgi:hypothetical protein